MRVIIIGAGGIGQHLAQQLGAGGHDVVLGSRSGSGIGPSVSRTPSRRITTVQVDAVDRSAVLRLCRGADALVNAVNPPYTKWAVEWPPMAESFLAAAEQTGAGLLTIGNLYAYGIVSAPMTETQPLAPNGVKSRVRADMWRQALAAHEAGRVRAVEIRPSDYFGPGAGMRVSYLNRFAIAPAMRGRRAHHIRGDLSAPHTWSYVNDIAALSVAVLEADHDGPDWGRPWHVPSPAPRTLTQVANDVARITGEPPQSPTRLAKPLAWALRVVPLIRELDETAHQFERPFILDASAAERRFGLQPTVWDQALSDTVAAMR